MAVPYDPVSVNSIAVAPVWGLHAIRRSLRRLGVPQERAAELCIHPTIFVLEAFGQGRRPLCDWYVDRKAPDHYEFHTNPAWDLTTAERLTVFEAGLKHMFGTGASVLDTYVEDSPESFGARHLLSCLGFKRGPRRLVDGEVRIYYQLTKGVYDARSTIHHGRDGCGGNGDSDVLGPPAAEGSSTTGGPCQAPSQGAE